MSVRHHARKASVDPCLSEIIDGQVWLGSLDGALALRHAPHAALGITHILSVCPDYPGAPGLQHLCVPVDDTEGADLLIHLPAAVAFIRDALAARGRVLVHCYAGVSRSATVLAAYLMATEHLSPLDALERLRARRPHVHPNFGFLQQLRVFGACGYAPSASHAAYRAWKRAAPRALRAFTAALEDTVCVLPDALYLCTALPSDAATADSVLWDMELTHVLALAPSAPPAAGDTPLARVTTRVLGDAESAPALLLAMRDACAWIDEARKRGGGVLVLCSNEPRACALAACYLMYVYNLSDSAACAQIEHALPLFSPTTLSTTLPRLFGATAHAPSAAHPAVRAWLAPPTPAPTPPAAAATHARAPPCSGGASHGEEGGGGGLVRRSSALGGPPPPALELGKVADALRRIQLEEGLTP